MEDQWRINGGSMGLESEESPQNIHVDQSDSLKMPA